MFLSYDLQGGAYLLDLIDHYSIGWNVLLIALSECLCVGWVYGQSSYLSQDSFTKKKLFVVKEYKQSDTSAKQFV